MANNRVASNRVFALLLAAMLTVILAACSQEDKPAPVPGTAIVSPEPEPEPEQTLDDPQEQVFPPEEEAVSSPGETTDDAALSLEHISAQDAGKFVEALKKEDAERLSVLTAHAENENTPETMRVVLAGFRLHFDQLTELSLSFDSNQQDEQYYIEHYRITGMQDGKERFVPLQVKYNKEQGMEAIRDDARREPLFDSPMLNQYPYMADDVKRYLRAITEEDKESLMLHLGLHDETEENKAAVDRLLGKYQEELDLNTANVVPVGYDEDEGLFIFDLQDDRGHSHRVQAGGGTWFMQDEWTRAE
ncbi:hypothetical protein [Paenibacillus kobensis]|uniref:hypothetical protein n=1 Tax=Paenibacillus kobensis TaxID=59841 RepID=UPI000FD94FA5|nr:hypothetical protein [Paenibacillus kobensis]